MGLGDREIWRLYYRCGMGLGDREIWRLYYRCGVVWVRGQRDMEAIL